MANKHRGELGFQANGKDWYLRFSVNSLCELEDDVGAGMGQIMERLQAGGDLRLIRAVFRGGLGNGVSKEQAGALIDEIGFKRASELIIEALGIAFPEAEEEGERPQKGSEAGIGKNS